MCGDDRAGRRYTPVAGPNHPDMIQAIDHLGIAVRSLDEAVPLYEKALGLPCVGREEVASQRVRTAFFDAGGVHLELLEPTAPDSPIAKFIAERVRWSLERARTEGL